MPVKVYLKNLRTAPRKVRLVVNLIRGMKVDEAMEQLKYIPQRATAPIMKLLESAAAAAKNDFKMNREDLFISKITVDDGATLKRSMPHAMGRAFPILKRTSFVTVELNKKAAVLETQEETKTEDEQRTEDERKVKLKKDKNLNKEK